MLVILLMGFSSGLPLLLTLSTLSYWLAKVGVDKTTIGLFALVGMPYSFKFLWAPLLDQARIPLLTRLVGRRRGWALVAQALSSLAILAMGMTDPAVDPWWTAAAALAVAFFSASQDIVIDAYRIEILPEDEQGAGAAATQVGYRIGLIIVGRGRARAFRLRRMAADLRPPRRRGRALHGGRAVRRRSQSRRQRWVAGAREPMATQIRARRDRSLHGFHAAARLARHPRLRLALQVRRRDRRGHGQSLLRRARFHRRRDRERHQGLRRHRDPGRRRWPAVSWWRGYGMFRSLLLGGILQAAANLLFAVLAGIGHDVLWLAVAIGADNFTGGLGSAAFVAYLSSLCSVAFTATQYALLTSFMAAGRTMLSSGAGWLATVLGWPAFFVATTFLAVPGLLLLFWLARLYPAGAATAPPGASAPAP